MALLTYVYDPDKNILSQFEDGYFSGTYAGDPADVRLKEVLFDGADLAIESFSSMMKRLQERIDNELKNEKP